MTHTEAFRYKREAPNLSPPRPEDRMDCQGVLVETDRGFWDDCSWTVTRCEECGDTVVLCGGGVHWWNYTKRRMNQ